MGIQVLPLLLGSVPDYFQHNRHNCPDFNPKMDSKIQCHRQVVHRRNSRAPLLTSIATLVTRQSKPDNLAGGDFRKVYSGNSTFLDNFAAGTAFVVTRRSDAQGLQLSSPGDHGMIATVTQGLSGWVWTSPGVRVYGLCMVNPVWIAVNMVFRARGLRLGADATVAQLNAAEALVDGQAAIDAAAICNDSVTKMVGVGMETQFAFRGTIQEEKPLRDWLQEVLMNCTRLLHALVREAPDR